MCIRDSSTTWSRTSPAPASGARCVRRAGGTNRPRQVRSVPWFTGHNELPHRTWETRSEVVVAERGREFAWVVGGSFVRWGFTLVPAGLVTTLTESWEFLPGGIAMFEEKFGDEANAQITDRTQQALVGIPKTLAAIKQIAESTTDAGKQAPS